MVEILEVPVISTSSEFTKKLIQSLKTNEEHIYQGLRHYTLKLRSAREIYLYLLDNAFIDDNFELWDLVIPKAPFLLYVEEPDSRNDIGAQIEGRYETPLFKLNFDEENDDTDGSTIKVYREIKSLIIEAIKDALQKTVSGH